MGYRFYFTAGPGLLPSSGFTDHAFFDLNAWLFTFSFRLGYFHGLSDISAGFNLVPLAYLFLFNRAVDKERKERQALLDSFMKRETRKV